MRRMVLVALGLALGVAGCKGGDKKAAPGANQACAGGAVDTTKLTGVWVKEILHNDGSKEQKPELRVKFGGGDTVGFVAGVNLYEMKATIAPGKVDLAEVVSAKDEELFKKENKDPNLGLRQLLYIRPKARGCRMEAMPKYETYVDGKRLEQNATVGQFDLAPYRGKEVLSFEKCTEVEKVSLAKGSMVISGETSTLIAEGKASDLGEGCTPSSDFYYNGKRVVEGAPGKVEGDKAIFEVTHTFGAPEAGVNAFFAEVYRYADCGGKKTLKGVACNAIPLQ